MPSPSSRPGRTVRAVSALVVAASAAYFWATNLADEDLWNHLNFGEQKLRTLAVPTIEASSYSAPGHPWFNHEWGAEVIFALCYRWGGTAALFALKIAAGIAIVAAMLAAGRTLVRETDEGEAHPTLVAGVLLVALSALAPGASFRPQLFTMTGLAVEWWLLVRADARLFRDGSVGRELVLVPLVVWAWTNLHGGFAVGVALHGLFVAGVLARAALARSFGEPAPRAAALALVCASGVATLLGTTVNPYGPALLWYLATTLADHGRITEWLPLDVLAASHLSFDLLALATLACAAPWWLARTPRSARLDWRLAFLAIALVAALRHQRHSVLFVIVATPVLLAAAEHVRRGLVARRPALAPRPPVLAWIAAGALLVAAVQLGGVATRFAHDGLAIRYERTEFPADAIAFLRDHDVRGNMAVQFEWGGYTLVHLADRARVFIDGRYEASYPPAVMDDWWAFIEGGDGWSRVLDAYPTDVVLVERTATIVPLLDGRPDLARVYADGTAVVYLRRTPANAEAIADLTAVAARRPVDARPTYFP